MIYSDNLKGALAERRDRPSSDLLPSWLQCPELARQKPGTLSGSQMGGRGRVLGPSNTPFPLL